MTGRADLARRSVERKFMKVIAGFPALLGHRVFGHKLAALRRTSKSQDAPAIIAFSSVNGTFANRTRSEPTRHAWTMPLLSGYESSGISLMCISAPLAIEAMRR
jgi:hypothetical protein